MAVVRRGRAGGARNYPPLVMAAAMMLGLLAVLPSALNIPQSTPSETLEYAPVPPEDEANEQPPAGNFSSLGLGSSSGLAADSEGDRGGLPPDDGGAVGGRAVKTPSTKRCVGDPPRQTEDPLAPPCVAYFDGDNGGATYQGVSREEVRVLMVIGGFRTAGTAGDPSGSQRWPSGEYFDLAKPAEDDEHSSLRYPRAWQRYFNERFQTYGRFVHFFAYYAKAASNPEVRRAEAAENYERIKPFAVVWPTAIGGTPAYNEVMASKGVMTFSSQFGLRSEIFRKYPKVSWGYLPSLEEHATSFSAFVCEKVAGKPVAFSGNAGENGMARKYGLIYSEETGVALSDDFVALVKPEIARCGVEFAAEATHPYHAVAYDGRTSGDYAAAAMARFQQEGITTILWMFGYETNFSRSAAAINYRPEWILAGDGFSEALWGGQHQEQSVWDHAVSYTFNTRTLFGGFTQVCKEAYIQADPEIARGTLDMTIACYFYDELRQLFTGIQVSGPRLNPDTMDKGFHAIPAVRSSDPWVPACFYRPGDYTCVKDGTVVWYDSQYQDEHSGNTAGCWRMTDGGQRHLPGGWPEGNVDAQQKASDPCDGNLGGVSVVPA